MKTDYSDLNVLVVDSGECMDTAIALAPHFNNVFLSLPIDNTLSIKKAYIGTGLEGLIRIGCDIFSDYDEFSDYAYEDIDFFMFTSNDSGGIQQKLIDEGKNVWGAVRSEKLEFDRGYLLELLEELGLPVPESKKFKGLDALQKYLENREDLYGKLNKYRGDKETFHWRNKQMSISELNDIRNNLGVLAEELEFIAQKPIKAVTEPGIDTWFIKGKYPSKAMIGYEIKSCAYVSVVLDWEDISPLIKDIPEKLAPTLEKLECNGHLSTEVKITEDGKSYLLDWTAREGTPPHELFYLLYENYAEIIAEGSKGNLVEPVIAYKFGAIAHIYSDWQNREPQPIEIPKKIKPFVRIEDCFKKDGIYYFCTPEHFRGGEIGSVMGVSNDNLEDAIEHCKKNAGQIVADCLDIKLSALDEALEEVKKGEKVGIKFS